MLPAVGAGASRQSARLPREEPGGRRRLPGQRAALDATRLQPQGQVAARDRSGGRWEGTLGGGKEGEGRGEGGASWHRKEPTNFTVGQIKERQSNILLKFLVRYYYRVCLA